MQRVADRLPSAPTIARIALIVFVLAWIFGPYALRAAVPIWLPFLIALGLELHFFAGGLHPAPTRRSDRGPQETDRELYGYDDGAEELLLVRDGDDELWVPYAGETEEEVEALIAEARDRDADEPRADEVPALEEPRRRGALLRLLVGLGVIGALVLVFWLVERHTGWSGLDRTTRAEATARFSREASLVAGKPVTIRCDEAGEYVGAVQHADGVALVGGDLAYLTPERCLALYRAAFEGEIRSNETGRAIAVLAHEAWHLRGVADEGTTECYALQSGVRIAKRMGLSESGARRLMRAQLVENAIRGRQSPAYALPADCRDGGGLDLAPENSGFP